MKDNTKEEIEARFDALIEALGHRLGEVKKNGGTMGHKVGGIRDKIVQLKGHFKDL